MSLLETTLNLDNGVQGSTWKRTQAISIVRWGQFAAGAIAQRNNKICVKGFAASSLSPHTTTVQEGHHLEEGRCGIELATQPYAASHSSNKEASTN